MPPGAQAIEIERGDAQVRGWIFDPIGEPRGTILMLHGIRSDKRNLVGGALGHTARGLRAIAIDSRGHGESAGRYLTYGVEEALDLVQLVDALEQRGLLAKPLSVVGSSYGGATALQYAARDPRVDRVVALAPFASLREVVPAYIAWKLGPLALLVPSALIDDLLDGATGQAAFDADAACPRCVAPAIQASVLLIHSRDDERIPWQHSAAIQKALRSPVELMLVDGADHVSTGNGTAVATKIDRFLHPARN
jgi:alpha-beta hydrolase superfamily lysophospholipase